MLKLPKPFRKQGQQLCSDGNTTVFFDAYNVDHMHDAYQQGLAEQPERAPLSEAELEQEFCKITELKRLSEAAKAAFSNSYEHTSNRVDFEMAASPDVVLGLIKSLEHTTMAAETEAEEVDARNAVIDKLCTQNQALREALKDLKRQYSEHPDAFWDWSKARAALALAEGGV